MPTFDLLFDALVEQPSLHAPSTAFYRLCARRLRDLQHEPLFSTAEPVARDSDLSVTCRCLTPSREAAMAWQN